MYTSGIKKIRVFVLKCQIDTFYFSLVSFWVLRQIIFIYIIVMLHPFEKKKKKDQHLSRVFFFLFPSFSQSCLTWINNVRSMWSLLCSKNFGCNLIHFYVQLHSINMYAPWIAIFNKSNYIVYRDKMRFVTHSIENSSYCKFFIWTGPL